MSRRIVSSAASLIADGESVTASFAHARGARPSGLVALKDAVAAATALFDLYAGGFPAAARVRPPRSKRSPLTSLLGRVVSSSSGALPEGRGDILERHGCDAAGTGAAAWDGETSAHLDAIRQLTRTTFRT